MAAAVAPSKHFGESSAIASRTMEGGGTYTAKTKGCFDVIHNARDLVGSSLAAVPPAQSGTAFTIADYGTADGGTSIDLVAMAIDMVRETMGEEQEIVVLYEDIPTNPFGPLFQMTQGMMPLPGGRVSFLAKHPKGVYVHAVGTSFYKPVAPKGSVDFGISFTAMHWTSKVPCSLPTVLHSVQADDATRSAFAAQAAADWELILAQRAKELKCGGRLVMANFCVDEKGCYLGHTAERGGPSVCMHATFARLWAGLRDEGAITAAEFDNTNFPQHYRTVDEFAAPLTDESSAAFKAGLRLESVETRHTPCPFAKGWKAGEYADGASFAADYVPTLGSWSSSVFRSGLSKERSKPEQDAVIRTLWQRYEAEVAKNPAAHGMDYIHAFIVIRKL